MITTAMPLSIDERIPWSWFRFGFWFGQDKHRPSKGKIKRSFYVYPICAGIIKRGHDECWLFTFHVIDFSVYLACHRSSETEQRGPCGLKLQDCEWQYGFNINAHRPRRTWCQFNMMRCFVGNSGIVISEAPHKELQKNFCPDISELYIHAHLQITHGVRFSFFIPAGYTFK